MPPDGQLTAASAIGSGSGSQVFVGMSSNGQIYMFDPAHPDAITRSSNLSADGSPSIVRIIVQQDGDTKDVFVVRNNETGGAIYHTSDGQNWDSINTGDLPGTTLWCMETDWTVTPKTLFVATDDAVFASRDNGNSWENISQGLPRRPHCSDLAFVQQADGTRYLYMASFGWSVWRTRLL